VISRRTVLQRGASALAGSVALLRGPDAHAASAALAALHADSDPEYLARNAEHAAQHGYTPVTVPNGTTLPWTMADGVKVFHLVAEVIKHEFAPGLVIEAWGYNGRTPGPVIEAVEGDRVRIYVTNKLPEPTTVHWHGVKLPNGMDGVAGLTQPPIQPGETFKYEFTLRQHGTFMYHPHFDEMVQMGMGMMGMFVIHPKANTDARPRVARDFAIMLSEWFVEPGAARPDTSVMSDFNILTMNSKVFPATAPLVAATNERVRIRLGNLSAMDHHPLHIHGYQFQITGTDGGPIPPSAQYSETSILVPVGSTRDIEFVTDAPGDWAFHCHMTHHVMNQMGHGLPNMMGVKTDSLESKVHSLLPGYMSMGQSGMGDMADMGMHVPANSIPMMGGPGQFGTIGMGGMFTVIKVRDHVALGGGDPGWYHPPPHTTASVASPEELRADGITT
jgi:FtsP/CotA-like multicopper oxidase with cupredoxin domain